MDFVEPIRDRKKITQIKNQLNGAGRFRDHLLFVVGINSALRISDILPLRIGDFIDAEGEVRQQFSLREEKREKPTGVVITDSMRQALSKYIDAYPQSATNPNPTLFSSTHPL